MYYELYVDSLFFINFIMNLYLLILVDHSTLRSAAPGRLMMGAALGALAFLLPFLWTISGFPVILKLAAGALIGTVGMLCITFPVKGLRMFLKLLERLLLYTFGMGGAMLFLIRSLRSARGILTGAFGILGVGAFVYLLLHRFHSDPLKAGDSLCRAILFRNGEQVRLTALIDSGNSLTEPISGKPVCVVDREIFGALWKQEEGPFRVIPYHSIGKKKGIMRGFPLPKLQLEVDGIRFIFQDVYIAVSDETISGAKDACAESVKMIVNPELFTERKKGKPYSRQNERHNDFKSDNTGQDAI